MDDSDSSARKKRTPNGDVASTPPATPKRLRVITTKPEPSLTTPLSTSQRKRASASNSKPASNRKRGRPAKKARDVFEFDDEDENSAPIATPLLLLSAKKSTTNGHSESEVDSNKCPPEIDAASCYSDDSESESLNAPTNGTTSSTEDNQKFCSSCFLEIEDEESVTCSGPCLLTYHTKCLKIVEIAPEWQCQECTTGNHRCFVCSTHTDTVEKCSVKECGRFYHVDCLSRYPHKKTENSFTCPLHFCLTCYNDHDEDNLFRSVNRRLLQCVRCPTAYHFLDDCLAAGSSVIVPKLYIECPEHLDRKSFKVCNVSYCFACLFGGDIICCEGCPAAFHEKCLDFPVPQGPFYCGACLKRKQVVYGETVWVKLGSYRWWPASVIAPMNVPDNLMKKKWVKGQFVVKFAGSNDYYWVDKGRVFPYVEGDALKQHNTAMGRSKMDQLYKQALVDIQKIHQKFLAARSEALIKKVKKYAPYKKILTNRPVGSLASLFDNEKEDKNGHAAQCTCDAESSSPCSAESNCLNRLMNFECHPNICKAGEKCQNQRFKKRQYVKAKPFNTGSRGWGLKALQDIKEGTFVIEYVGELIDENELNRRLDEKAKINDRNFYFLTLDKDRIIDAGPSGNLARFMNHSCQPNCITQKWVVNGSNRVGLFAVRDIKVNEELTFNYNLAARGNEKTQCRCGADQCSRFIGDSLRQPKTTTTKRKKTL